MKDVGFTHTPKSCLKFPFFGQQKCKPLATGRFYPSQRVSRGLQDTPAPVSLRHTPRRRPWNARCTRHPSLRAHQRPWQTSASDGSLPVWVKSGLTRSLDAASGSSPEPSAGCDGRDAVGRIPRVNRTRQASSGSPAGTNCTP